MEFNEITINGCEKIIIYKDTGKMEFCFYSEPQFVVVDDEYVVEELGPKLTIVLGSLWSCMEMLYCTLIAGNSPEDAYSIITNFIRQEAYPNEDCSDLGKRHSLLCSQISNLVLEQIYIKFLDRLSSGKKSVDADGCITFYPIIGYRFDHNSISWCPRTIELHTDLRLVEEDDQVIKTDIPCEESKEAVVTNNFKEEQKEAPEKNDK